MLSALWPDIDVDIIAGVFALIANYVPARNVSLEPSFHVARPSPRPPIHLGYGLGRVPFVDEEVSCIRSLGPEWKMAAVFTSSNGGKTLRGLDIKLVQSGD